MSVKIGSNISSLQAQRRLGEASSSLSKVYEKLSSGQRIRRASDDAAGLAISETLDAKARIFTQGVRNLNDGLSFTAIATGAMKELKAVLLRQRELATQASNGTYSDKQRQAMEVELKELSSEWNRILDSTAFNGRVVFSAKNGTVTLQAGVGTEAVLSAAFGSREAAAQDDVRRVSLGYDGSEANGNSAVGPGGGGPAGVVSADGRFFAFQSTATNLVAGDSIDALRDLFVTDVQTGVTQKVSRSVDGSGANGVSLAPALSADGRYVAFYSLASNLVADDSNGSSDVFVADLRTGTMTMASRAPDGSGANSASQDPTLSADGRYLAFTSYASNLVPGDTADGFYDIFVKDLQTGEIQKITGSSSGGAANASSSVSVFSADGRYVAFNSLASNLVEGDADDGVNDVFVKDLQTGAVTKATGSSAGGAANNSCLLPTISADGRYVALYSTASNLVEGDTADGVEDIFVKDLHTGEMRKITGSSSGGAANANSSHPVLSADGRYVTFQSLASNLVAGDTVDVLTDIFVEDLQTGEIRKLPTSLSGGAANGHSLYPTISADGRYLGFKSDASDLVCDDDAGYRDIFVVGNPFSEWSAVSRNQWLSVATVDRALLSGSRIENYLTELNEVDGAIGALEARLSTAMSNLHSMTENFRAAESRITDADVGMEAANLTRTQIVQQAAASVLAQANQQPEIALSLLRETMRP